LRRFLFTFPVAVFASLSAFADGEVGDQVVAKFLSAQESQRMAMRDVRMEVDIKAAIPRLAKMASLRAFRGITRMGKVTYDALRFDGDNTVRKDVIARFLSSEIQASENPDPRTMMNRENYKFKYKGLAALGGKELHMLEVTPKKKRVGLYKGVIWLDLATCLPVHEEGRFVKSPSVFLKKIEFARDLEIRDGVSVPTRMTSSADTRIVGRTELSIAYSNFKRLPAPPSGPDASLQ
jgi:hypothetical protein